MSELKPKSAWYPTLSAEDKTAFDIVFKLFKNDYGEPFEMTPGQISLFRAIYEKQSPRIQFDCYTQYGKSDVVSMAVLLRVSTFQEKWIILGATKDKAGIIMSKLIKHIFENDYTLGKFQIDEGESLDFIRRNRAKDNISFKIDDSGMGQVITLSADARRKSADAGDILIGHGGQNLIIDDAALVPNPIYGKALRMLGGHKDNFMLKITNSFGGNDHAIRSAEDSDNVYGTRLKEPPKKPKFRRIVIDYRQGIEEGRLTSEFIQEMRQSLDSVMFGILYECIYPPSDMIEDGGWFALLTPEQIEEAEARSLQSIGHKRLGVDVSEGTNENAFVIRTDNVALVKETSVEKDLMKTAERVVGMIAEERIAPEQAWIDAVAIGAGVYSRVKQMGLNVHAFKGGESPTEKNAEEKLKDPLDYYNLRAEVYWKLRNWVLQGGALSPHKSWKQLSKIKARTTSDKKIQIMTKEEMRARGDLGASESTDVPDALSMTFVPHIVRFDMNAKQSAPPQPYYPDVDGQGGGVSGTPLFQQSQGGFNHDLR